MQNNKLKLKSGFTLIEMMVALAVFMVVMTITLAAFLNIVDIQKKTEAFRKVNDNLNFSMEMMMREIREGWGYDVGGESFTFTSRAETKLKSGIETKVTYSLNDTTEADLFIERCLASSACNGNGQRITSGDVKITSLYFTVIGWRLGPYNGGTDTKQPRVTISISGKSGVKEKIQTDLDLQATVSQRKIDS